jgi:carboxyl-terminal processing protease
MKAMLKSAKVAEPADLEQRVSGLRREADLAGLLRQVWPEMTNPDVPPAEKLESALIQGLLKRVPGDSEILPASDLKLARQASGNRYVGVGIQLKMNDEEKRPQVVTPYKGGTARQAGMLAGDLIIEVDGKDARGVELRKVVEWLRGDLGSSLTVAVRQPESAESRTLHMTRRVVPIDTVLGYRRSAETEWSYRIDPSAPIGYVHVDSINSSTVHELRQAERRLRAEGVEALVLDFRSSVGDGLLHNAALLADALLDGGLMWRVVDGHKQVQEFHADRECLYRDWPLVVLCSGPTDRAHGAIVAALQDHRRAAIIGTALEVDGYVDSLVDLPGNDGALRVRTGRLERASPSRGWPVRPDIEVEINEPQKKAIEAWLAAKQQTDPPAALDLPSDDPQLAKAVEWLRAALKSNGKNRQP